MKKLAIFLILAVLVIAGLLLYGLFQGRLQVIAKELEVHSAAETQAWFHRFERDKTAVERNALLGTKIRSGELGNAQDYVYRVYTLRVKNPGFVDAEMVEIQLAPDDRDVLYYGESGKVDIKAGETRDIWCVLLTEGNTPNVRNFYLTYYLWGNPHEVKFTYDDTK